MSYCWYCESGCTYSTSGKLSNTSREKRGRFSIPKIASPSVQKMWAKKIRSLSSSSHCKFDLNGSSKGWPLVSFSILQRSKHQRSSKHVIKAFEVRVPFSRAASTATARTVGGRGSDSKPSHCRNMSWQERKVNVHDDLDVHVKKK